VSPLPSIFAIINESAQAYKGVIPVDRWHESLADPTLADAILDRLVHNAHALQLCGESMRRVKAEALQRNVTNPEGDSHAPEA